MQWPTDFVSFWLLLPLALYGLIDLGAWVVSLIRGRSGDPVNVVILVQNQESQIEGFVRSLRGELIHRGQGAVWLVDLASSDDTPRILERLVAADHHIHVVRLRPGEPLDRALGLAAGRLAMLVDLRERGDLSRVLVSLHTIWNKKENL